VNFVKRLVEDNIFFGLIGLFVLFLIGFCTGSSIGSEDIILNLFGVLGIVAIFLMLVLLIITLVAVIWESYEDYKYGLKEMNRAIELYIIDKKKKEKELGLSEKAGK